MKSTLAKKSEVNLNWYLIDANGKTLGRMATKIADYLRGKNKAIFSPQMDCGDYIIVINAEKVLLTGGKWDKKTYVTHSPYPGSLKEKTARKVVAETPTKLIELAVRGMLPKNRLRKNFMKKLKLYAGEEHPHEAQSPIKLEV